MKPTWKYLVLFVWVFGIHWIDSLAGEVTDHPGRVIELGQRRELFVDRFLIERMEGLELRMQKPRPMGTVIQLDRPWEGIVSGYITVIKDTDRYLMYYRGRPSTSSHDGSKEAGEVTCVVESADGVTWGRPRLGLFEAGGTRDNNVILTEPKNVTHNLCPFLDTRSDVPINERFKAVGGTGKAGLFGYVSPDGIRWQPVRSEALITEGAFDSQNLAFWSECEKCYVCYFRTWKTIGDVGYRWISRSTSKDFLHWPGSVEMSYGDTPPEHLYVNQTQPYFRAPHIYIALAARFYPGRNALTDEQIKAMDLRNPRNYAKLDEACSDAVLMSSRGSAVYDRVFMESFIRPGGDPQDWVARSNYPALGIVPTGPREMSIYIGRHYGQPSIHVERMTLRTDGFASVHAPFVGGEMVTKSLTFTGDEMEINFETSAAGGIRVEIQDASGKALTGYGLSDCGELIGDQVDRLVTWKGGAKVGSLAGKPVRLRFAMKDADLYSFRFRTSG